MVFVNRLLILATLFILCTPSLLVCTALADEVVQSSGTLDTTSNEIELMLGTKTKYYPQQSHDERVKPPESCKPKYLNLVARHGSRWPTKTWYSALENLQNWTASNKHALQQNEKFSWAADWKNPVNEKHIGKLKPQGKKQLRPKFYCEVLITKPL